MNRSSSLARANTSNNVNATRTTLTANHLANLNQFGADLWKLADTHEPAVALSKP